MWSIDRVLAETPILSDKEVLLLILDLFPVLDFGVVCKQISFAKAIFVNKLKF